MHATNKCHMRDKVQETHENENENKNKKKNQLCGIWKLASVIISIHSNSVQSISLHFELLWLNLNPKHTSWIYTYIVVIVVVVFAALGPLKCPALVWASNTHHACDMGRKSHYYVVRMTLGSWHSAPNMPVSIIWPLLGISRITTWHGCRSRTAPF